MAQLPIGPWQIKKDNEVVVNPYEWRQLHSRRHLEEKTMFIECPNYPDMDQSSARLTAEMAKGSAVIGGYGYIVVKGPRWSYEFKTKELMGKDRWWNKRPGVFMNPFEFQESGCFFDTTRQLWSVPRSYNVRERTVFHVKSVDNDKSSTPSPGV